MPPSKNPPTARRQQDAHVLVGRAACSILLRLNTHLDRIRASVAGLVGHDDAERDRPHVATIATLMARGWRVGEIRPSTDAPVLWRVTAERYDGTVSITVMDAADPDAALEELVRYAAADSTEAR